MNKIKLIFNYRDRHSEKSRLGVDMTNKADVFSRTLRVESRDRRVVGDLLCEEHQVSLVTPGYWQGGAGG